MTKWLIAVMSLLLTVGDGVPVAAASVGETITFSHYPGGLCPNYSFQGCTPFTITLYPDDSGTVAATNESGRHESAFQASPAEARTFRDRLKPFRKGDKNGPACQPVVTDGDTIDINWHVGERFVAHLALNGGCQFPGKDRMWKALSSAPSLLPIADRIGLH